MAQPAPKQAVVDTATEAPKAPPTHEQIATLAYALWQARGCPDGSPEQDWLAAEQQSRVTQG